MVAYNSSEIRNGFQLIIDHNLLFLSSVLALLSMNNKQNVNPCPWTVDGFIDVKESAPLLLLQLTSLDANDRFLCASKSRICHFATHAPRPFPGRVSSASTLPSPSADRPIYPAPQVAY